MDYSNIVRLDGSARALPPLHALPTYITYDQHVCESVEKSMYSKSYPICFAPRLNSFLVNTICLDNRFYGSTGSRYYNAHSFVVDV